MMKVSKRALVRRCSVALLLLGVASPIWILLGTGGFPTLNDDDGSASVGGGGRGSSVTRGDVRTRSGNGGGVPAVATGDAPGVGGVGDGRGGGAGNTRSEDRTRDRGGGGGGDFGAGSAEHGDGRYRGESGSPVDDARCASLANDWIHEQEERLTTRSRDGKSDLLFFLHIPRTAGRTFHFCYLKLATPEAKRCAKSYDELRINVDDPNCQLLATHDDYSLVERLSRQPMVVTMFRDPVARFLSSYEFAVEVSVRSFGEEIVNNGNNRVATRDVWPWQYLVRHVDRDLRRYKDRVEATGWKDSIANVYNNSVYTPLHEFVSLQVAHDDLHNGQFLQLLGLTNNSSPQTEPRAARVRACLRKGSVAAEALYRFAERRLRDEVDVTVVHERLEESLRFSSAALGLHMGGPGYGGGRAPPQHTKILRRKFQRSADAGLFSRDAIVVGFVFKFFRLTQEQLNEGEWRKNYVKAMRSVVAYSVGVTVDDVFVVPFGNLENFSDGKDGFQVAMVRYPTVTSREEGAVKMDPNALMNLLKVGAGTRTQGGEGSQRRLCSVVGLFSSAAPF